MKILRLLIFVLLTLNLSAQDYKIESFEHTDSAFLYLKEPSYQIANNDKKNELILDLVKATVVDSVVRRKRQHHKLGPLGSIISIFGYNWRAFSMHKEKIVGTLVRHRRSSKIQFTEYDIIFDLNFHLPAYQQRILEMYDQQVEYDRQDHRKDHKTDYTKAPYLYNMDSVNYEAYFLHCELTPEHAYLDSLNESFFPTRRKAGGVQDHVNFMTRHPTIGFYGLLCHDCNHNCKPEMHPYEWMWWLKCTPSDSTAKREWHIGFFHEGSNRQKKWSDNPKTGSISIPFAFHKSDSMIIEIDNTISGTYKELANEREAQFRGSNKSRSILVKGTGIQKEIELKFLNPQRTKGISYWISDLNYDHDASILSGYFSFEMSVEDISISRITFY